MSTKTRRAPAEAAVLTSRAVRAAGDVAASAALERWRAYGGFEASAALAGGSSETACAAQADASLAAEAAEVLRLARLEAQDDDLGAVIQARQDRAQAELLELRRRQDALHGAEQRVLAELDDVAREWQALEGGQLHMHQRSVAAQAAVPLRVSDRTIEARMAQATTLAEHWPTWLAALEAGEISIGHLHVLRDAGRPLLSGMDVTPEQRARFAEAALAQARRLSVPRLRKRAKQLADRALTTPAVERHREARKDRRVWVQPGDDGMATLGVHLPTTLALGIEHRLAVIARTKAKDDHRSIPNVMADTAAELLLTGTEAAGLPSFEHVRPVVHVTVPVASLESRDLDDGADGTVEPATLDGFEQLDVETARILAGQADVWRILYLDPVTNAPCGIKRHDPTALQREWLGMRDLWCRFKGCAAAAWRCDIDHAIPHSDGGCTDDDNLEHLCRRHHMLKHHSTSEQGGADQGGTGRHSWSLEHLGHGVIAWHDPANRVYVDDPAPLAFAARPTFTGSGPPTPPRHGDHDHDSPPF